MITARQLANEFTFIDLEPWISEIENRIKNVKYPSNADIELLPKLKEALEILENTPRWSEEEYGSKCMENWAFEHEKIFI